MWKYYSVNYLKNNRASAIFVMAAAFLSSMLLSFVSILFYNLWMDRLYQLYLEYGNYDNAVTPLIIVYLCIIIAASMSLILMLHNAFEVTMNARLHQLGILQSVGATPRQLKTVLVNEAVILSVFPVLAGTLTGIGICYAVWRIFELWSVPFRDYELRFCYNIFLSAASLLFSFFTVSLSVWLPAKKLSKVSPLEAIHYGAEPPVNRMKRFRIAASLFGIYGELARKSIYARRKAFRTSVISITFSFLAFVTFMNLETISGISTQHTYFERYRDKWDFHFNADEKTIREKELLSEIRELEGVQSCIAYRKITACTRLTEDMFSPELKRTGIGNLNAGIQADERGGYLIESPIYVLDNDSYAQYCNNEVKRALQPEPEVIAVNIIWDSLRSERNSKEYLPFLDAAAPASLEIYSGPDGTAAVKKVTVASFSDSLPQWKEEFQQYSLSLIASETFYESLKEDFFTGEIYFNIKTISEEENASVEKELRALLDKKVEYSLDSRLEQESSEGAKRRAFRIFTGFLAVLFSSIGLSNVFSATLGQIYQRRKEFARYMSVGLSPKGIRKILWMEMLILCLRPAVISIIINIPFVLWATNAGFISLKEFLDKAPVIPVTAFTVFILFFVGLAYYLGGVKICKGNIMDTLKDDTMI